MTTVSKKRVLIVHPYVTPQGGGNLLAAWILQALRHDFELELAALGPVDFPAVNRSAGTSLSPGDLRVHLAPAPYRLLLRSLPTQGAELERVLCIRHALSLDSAFKYDALFSTQNEADFLRPGLQYVHYPAYYLPRPGIELKWFHKIPGTLNAYRGLCRMLDRGTLEGPRRNLTLVNSNFVAARTRQWHQIDSVVVHPPVPGEFPDTPWERRQAGLVAVGRVHETKRWHWAVEIVDELRRRGLPLTFTLIGHEDQAAYGRRLRQMAETRPWFRMLHDLNRDQLAGALAQYRYGIHTMEEEHFGMGPAEVQSAGCITFVHNSGGPVEIVGGEPAVLFNNPGEAVEKIARVLSEPVLENRLRAHVAKQRELFGVERFCESIRAIVADFAAARARP